MEIITKKLSIPIDDLDQATQQAVRPLDINRDGQLSMSEVDSDDNDLLDFSTPLLENLSAAEFLQVEQKLVSKQLMAPRSQVTDPSQDRTLIVENTFENFARFQSLVPDKTKRTLIQNQLGRLFLRQGVPDAFLTLLEKQGVPNSLKLLQIIQGRFPQTSQDKILDSLQAMAETLTAVSNDDPKQRQQLLLIGLQFQWTQALPSLARLGFNTAKQIKNFREQLRQATGSTHPTVLAELSTLTDGLQLDVNDPQALKNLINKLSWIDKVLTHYQSKAKDSSLRLPFSKLWRELHLDLSKIEPNKIGRQLAQSLNHWWAAPGHKFKKIESSSFDLLAAFLETITPENQKTVKQSFYQSLSKEVAYLLLTKDNWLNEEELFREIWQGQKIKDPESWLRSVDPRYNKHIFSPAGSGVLALIIPNSNDKKAWDYISLPPYLKSQQSELEKLIGPLQAIREPLPKIYQQTKTLLQSLKAGEKIDPLLYANLHWLSRRANLISKHTATKNKLLQLLKGPQSQKTLQEFIKNASWPQLGLHLPFDDLANRAKVFKFPRNFKPNSMTELFGSVVSLADPKQTPISWRDEPLLRILFENWIGTRPGFEIDERGYMKNYSFNGSPWIQRPVVYNEYHSPLLGVDKSKPFSFLTNPGPEPKDIKRFDQVEIHGHSIAVKAKFPEGIDQPEKERAFQKLQTSLSYIPKEFLLPLIKGTPGETPIKIVLADTERARKLGWLKKTEIAGGKYNPRTNTLWIKFSKNGEDYIDEKTVWHEVGHAYSDFLHANSPQGFVSAPGLNDLHQYATQFIHGELNSKELARYAELSREYRLLKRGLNEEQVVDRDDKIATEESSKRKLRLEALEEKLKFFRLRMRPFFPSDYATEGSEGVGAALKYGFEELIAESFEKMIGRFKSEAGSKDFPQPFEPMTLVEHQIALDYLFRRYQVPSIAGLTPQDLFSRKAFATLSGIDWPKQ